MKRYSDSTLYQHQQGQQLVILALLLPVLLGVMALTVDLGNVYVRHRMVQNAADAAATAGASVLLSDGQTVAGATAIDYADFNGYNNDGTTNTVQPTFPTNCIRVTVTEHVQPILAAMVWNGTFTVNGVAKACNMTTAFASSVIVLDPTAAKALSLSGNKTLLKTPNGNVHVNSNNSKAVDLSGGATIDTDTPMTIVGGCSGCTPPFITGVAALPDPLASLPEPPASCTAARTFPDPKISKGGTYPLQFGCYPDGITISGGTTIFESGMYVIGGKKGLKVSGGANLSASNVTFFFAEGGLDLSGGGALSITPPSSGTYEGISIFQSRSNSDGMKITGNTALTGVQGTVYAPLGDVELSGGSSMQANFAVRTLKLSGGAELSVNGFESSNWSTTTYNLTE